ncbi:MULTISPECIES: ABC transporter ATP-binding protein [Terrabacteria group]|uniref:ABC transporter ATP-binding protein n=1 Tax=Bacillati TaxID=1783272 RepID=UPI001C6F0C8F|nr:MULTISPECIES: ABC transporter ATP-binding protein [Terrabacteria group]MBW9213069.1 ABC transporter ATP-binding protein [Trueperella sp. zg.1013]
MNHLLEANELSFAYQSNKTLDRITFKVPKGQLIYLTGKSGSGKSTLLNIINGIIPEVIEGELEGELFRKGNKEGRIEDIGKWISNIFQNPRSQFFTTNSTAELVFQMENYGFSKEEMKRRLNNLCDEFHIHSLLNRDIFSISSGERQLLALLTALIMKPEVLIFDEPSANLDYGNAMRLKKQMQQLKASGKTILVADHRYFYLKGVVDQIWVLEDKKMRCFDSEEAFLNSNYGKRSANLFIAEYPKRKIVPNQELALELRNIGYKTILKNISTKLYKKEICFLVGVNGAGKTTLARMIAGLVKADTGKLELKDKVLYMMQDADYQLFAPSVYEELRISQKKDNLNQKALEAMHLLEQKDQHPQTLSGGQKQRLQMAISMVSNQGIFLFDEPSSGLDKDSLELVAHTFQQLKEDKSLFVISHDYELIRLCAERILYLKEGKLQEDFYLTEDKIPQLNKIFIEMEKHYEK